MNKLCRTLFLFLLTVFWAPAAQASPLQLEIVISYFETPSWVIPPSHISFLLFEADYDAWGTSDAFNVRGPALAAGGGDLVSGMTQFDVTVPVPNLSNLYIAMEGSYDGSPPFSEDLGSIFVAEPPAGYVSDEQAYEHGPPWISLGSGLRQKGDLYVINGYGSQENSSDPYLVGTWSVEMVPEPATLLLFGIGIAGLVGARRKK